MHTKTGLLPREAVGHGGELQRPRSKAIFRRSKLLVFMIYLFPFF